MQAHQRQVPFRRGPIGPELQRVLERADGLAVHPRLAVGDAEIVVVAGLGRIQRHGLPVQLEGVVQPVAILLGVAHVADGAGGLGPADAERLAVAGDGGLRIAVAAQDHAQIAPGRGQARVEAQRLAPGADGAQGVALGVQLVALGHQHLRLAQHGGRDGFGLRPGLGVVEAFQRLGSGAERGLPGLRRLLAEHLEGVELLVRAGLRPAPHGPRWQQHQARLAQKPGDLGDAGIGGDHRLHPLDHLGQHRVVDGRRIDIGQGIDDDADLRQALELGAGGLLAQRHQPDAVAREKPEAKIERGGEAPSPRRARGIVQGGIGVPGGFPAHPHQRRVARAGEGGGDGLRHGLGELAPRKGGGSGGGTARGLGLGPDGKGAFFRGMEREGLGCGLFRLFGAAEPEQNARPAGVVRGGCALHRGLVGETEREVGLIERQPRPRHRVQRRRPRAGGGGKHSRPQRRERGLDMAGGQETLAARDRLGRIGGWGGGGGGLLRHARGKLKRA